MPSLFNGWGASWGSAWGPLESDPNAMRGAASISIHASIAVNSGEMSGSASFAIVAGLDNRRQPEVPVESGGGRASRGGIGGHYIGPDWVGKWSKDEQNRRQEEDAIMFAIINFVLEEA